MASLRLFFRPLVWPVTLMFYQLAILLFVTGGKLRSLVHWDAAWYRGIAVDGYSVTFPIVRRPEGGSNFAFFPAFPLWTRTIMKVTGLDPDLAIAVAAQLACVAFWAYFILILRKFHVRPAVILTAVIAYLVQPGAFYTVIGYSESLFMAALLGHVYWSTRAFEEEQRRLPHFLLAALHGAVMASTRFLGVILVVYPLLLAAAHALRDRKLSTRPLIFATSLSLLSLSGFLAHLAYCHFGWGMWNLYWEANRTGWNVYFNPWTLFSWAYYRDEFFVGNLSVVLGRIMTLVTLGVTVSLAKWTWGSRNQVTPSRLAITALALGFLLETMVGSCGMHSMIRYLLPIEALVFPLVFVRLQERLDEGSHSAQPNPWPNVRTWAAYAAIAGLMFALQVMFIIRYSRNDWVS